MRIVMIGCGAVGGYFGGRMREAGVDVTFLVRPGRAAQLRQTGLVIESPYGSLAIPDLRPVTTADEVHPCDLVVLAVKNYHLEQVVDQIRPLVARGAAVLPLLNGVEHYEQLVNAFGDQAVVGGLCQIIASMNGEGNILHTAPLHRFVFGALHPAHESVCRSLESALAGAKMEAIRAEQIWQEIWTKFGFIVPFSGVTTASRLPIQSILASAPTRDLVETALLEMRGLAAAFDVSMPEGFIRQSMEGMERMSEGATSSMHQDLRKGLQIEVESLQGAAVRLARRKGVLVPTIKTLYGLIKPFTNGIPTGGDLRSLSV